jgi:tRNA (guanine-N7-)-methyltransferase
MSTHQRRTEREFGVPIAGEILDSTQWTQTGLKKLPVEGHLHWEELFGRQGPVVLDLGCGNGHFLIGSSVWRPEHLHLGVDILPLVIRYATRRANQRGLTNIRFAVVGGKEVLDRWIAPGSVAEIHCYHPQPYYDPGQVHRRLVTPEFLALVHHSLISEGLFFFQTDNPGYCRYMQKIVPMFFDIQEQRGKWPDAPKGRTRREIIALRRRLPVFRAWGKARPNLDRAEAMRLAGTLPAPVFDASRALQELDALEQE